MRKQISLISVALLLLSWSATAGLPRTEAQRKISKLGAGEPLRSSAVGVFAMTMSGDTIADFNRMVKLVPASNMKLITTGVALRTLGASYRYETKIAYSGKIENGVLDGDVYIIGGGDPTTGAKTDCAEPLNSTFAKWAGFLRAAGITKVTGRIIGDPRYFADPVPENMGWTYDDLGTYYGAGSTGLNFFENAQNFYVTPGSAVGNTPYVANRYPDTPWMKYVNNARTGKKGSTNTMAYINTDFGPFGEFCGFFPIDRKGYTLECSNKFAAYTCAYYFHNYLRSNKISVEGGFADISSQGYVRTEPGISAITTKAPAQKDLTVLGSTFSSPASSIIGDANRDSDNFYAEALFKTIGKTGMGSSQYDSCYVAVENALKALGVSTAGAIQIFDGSGLSRKNYVSPDFLVRFLRAMAKSSDYEVYRNSLPVPGHKGTVEFKFPNTPLSYRERFHMKSGSMNGVRCYSGYIDSSDGDPSKTIVFSLMMNNLTVSTWAINPYIDNIIEALAAEN